MGAGQFLRDFRRDYHVEKSCAHRKKVMQRKEATNMKKLKVDMKQIEEDVSEDKKLTHLRLGELVRMFKAEGVRKLYQKKELQKLCDVYNIKYLDRWNKSKLANDLVEAIIQNDVMPASQVLSVYRTSVLEEHLDTVPVIRISRVLNS